MKSQSQSQSQSQSKSLYSEILILGAGPNGLALACGLAQSGFSVRIIDSQRLDSQESFVPSLRVSALTSESLRFLNSLGLDLEIFKNFKFSSMEVWESQAQQKLFLKTPGLIIENQFLQKMLYERARSLGVIFEYELINNINSIETTASLIQVNSALGEAFQANLLIGAEGANSFVREACLIKTEFKNYDQKAIVCKVQTEKSHEKTAYQIFLNQGPLAFLPLEHSHECSIVWSCASENAERFLKEDPEIFERILEKNFEHRLGALKLISERMSFALRRHHAKRYIANRAVLIGDAAHVIHPLAGLGLNLGLKDSEVLIKYLNLGRSQHRPLGSPHVLSWYERERKPHNALISMGMTGINYLFKSPIPGAKILRSYALNQVEKSAWWKRFLLSRP